MKINYRKIRSTISNLHAICDVLLLIAWLSIQHVPCEYNTTGGCVAITLLDTFSWIYMVPAFFRSVVRCV